MKYTPEDIAAWQSNLAETFKGPKGIVGERLFSLQEAERLSQSQGISSSKGYAVLVDSFFDFSIQTIDILSRPILVYHLLRTPLIVSSISRLRSSYCLFWMGYYFDATSLLRGLFESAIHLCADARREGSLTSWFSAGDQDLDGSPKDIKKVIDFFKKYDQKVQAIIFREKSSLSEEDQQELAMLVRLLHSHVHRTEMHLVHLMSHTERTRMPASLFPHWDGHVSSHSAHVSCFIAWMFTRLMSHAVPHSQRSLEWVNSRDILDQSFRFWFNGWDKPLAATVIRFIDAKFQFVGEWGEPDP